MPCMARDMEDIDASSGGELRPEIQPSTRRTGKGTKLMVVVLPEEKGGYKVWTLACGRQLGNAFCIFVHLCSEH